MTWGDTQTEERWTLDGEEVDLADLYLSNPETFTVAETTAVSRMVPGDEHVLGGGAGAEFVLRREA